MFPTTVTTERLRLRPVRLDDADAIYERYATDPQVTRFMSWRTNTHVEETREFLRHCVEAERGDTAQERVWAICFEGDPAASGTIGLLRRGTRAELGFALRRSLWGQGVMTEAASALLASVWARAAESGLWRIQAYCHVDHHASARVLTKCGLREEGVARRMHTLPQLGPDPQDCLILAQTRDDVTG